MQKSTIKTVLRYIKRYRVLVVLSLIFAAVTAALTLYVPILTGQGIDCMVSKGKIDFAALGEIILKIIIIQ